MRAVMGILEPSDGAMTWDGHPLNADDRRTFGYMPEERGLYPQMRLLDQVAYFARLHGLTQTAAVAAAGTWLERLGLREREHDKVVVLSHGNQQRAQLAVALVHGPPQLILDEPFAGLDPEAVDSLSGILRGLATGTLVELRARVPAHQRVRVNGTYEWAAHLPGVHVEHKSEDGIFLRVDPGTDSQSILRAAQAAGAVDHFAFESGTLTDLYRQLVVS
jgi:ABC-2 type transport system ATP-binding protein